MNPIQKYFTPNEQFLGKAESRNVAAAETADWASLATREASVAAALAILWALLAAMVTIPGMEGRFRGMYPELPLLSMFKLLNYMPISLLPPYVEQG